ncbi:MAG: hypothetical protein IJY24_04700 [Clostridia bacterium]|nr:hypothetical protein [Clostridia bacterium]
MTEGKRPAVLLFGNGPLRAFGGESWDEFLASMRRREDLPEGVDFVKKIKCPEPLKAIIITGDDVDAAMEKKCRELMEKPLLGQELYEMLRAFLTVGFDHIITTNYTYELESVLTHPAPITMGRLRSITRGNKRGAGKHKRLIRTYNEIAIDGVSNKVWHIHGELLRPGSTVIGHYYYGNMLFRIKEEVDRLSGKRQSEEAENWVEAFLFGDIYCVGFGFGLSELDMWWLLNQKARAKGNEGRLYFYDPMPSGYNEKRDLLSQLRSRSTGEPLVEILDLGFSLSGDESSGSKRISGGDFRDFYYAVIADLRKRLAR